MFKSKLRTLRKWFGALSGPLSLYRAVRLYRSGCKRISDRGPETALKLRARGLSLDLYFRPGAADFVTFLELFVNGEYAPAIDLVQPPIRWIIDLGGNVGLATAYFHQHWPHANLVTVEPDPANARTAQKTLGPLIASGKVKFHQNFIGSHERYAQIVPGGGGGSNELKLGTSLTKAAQLAHASVAQVITMSSLLDEYRIEFIDLLKCDIEGGEAELFEDCSHWIKKVRFLVVELHEGRNAEWLEGEIRRNGGSCKLLRCNAKEGEDISVAWYSCNGS